METVVVVAVVVAAPVITAAASTPDERTGIRHRMLASYSCQPIWRLSSWKKAPSRSSVLYASKYSSTPRSNVSGPRRRASVVRAKQTLSMPPYVANTLRSELYPPFFPKTQHEALRPRLVDLQPSFRRPGRPPEWCGCTRGMVGIAGSWLCPRRLATSAHFPARR